MTYTPKYIPMVSVSVRSLVRPENTGDSRFVLKRPDNRVILGLY